MSIRLTHELLIGKSTHLCLQLAMNDYDWLATGNGSIVCRCVWSRTIAIGYYIAIVTGGQVSEQLLTTCRCVLHDWTSGNIWLHFRLVADDRLMFYGQFCAHGRLNGPFMLSDYWGHFTLKSHILLAKWSVGVGTRFFRIKESFILELNPWQTIMLSEGGFADNKRCPD